MVYSAIIKEGRQQQKQTKAPERLKMARTKPMRVQREFEIFIDGLSRDFAEQTGLPKNNTATMRRMAMKLDGRLITRGTDFDFAIFGKRKKRR